MPPAKLPTTCRGCLSRAGLNARGKQTKAPGSTYLVGRPNTASDKILLPWTPTKLFVQSWRFLVLHNTECTAHSWVAHSQVASGKGLAVWDPCEQDDDPCGQITAGSQEPFKSQRYKNLAQGDSAVLKKDGPFRGPLWMIFGSFPNKMAITGDGSSVCSATNKILLGFGCDTRKGLPSVVPSCGKPSPRRQGWLHPCFSPSHWLKLFLFHLASRLCFAAEPLFLCFSGASPAF